MEMEDKITGDGKEQKETKLIKYPKTQPRWGQTLVSGVWGGLSKLYAASILRMYTFSIPDMI